MDVSSTIALKVLSKIGAPLTAAVIAHGSNKSDSDIAQTMAHLIAQATDLALAIHQKMDLNETPEQGDATRLMLAGLCAEQLAGYYTLYGQSPDSAAFQKIQMALEALLPAIEKFPKAAGDSGTYKPTIATASTSVIQAISDFPFGQPETKLVQSVTERVIQDATQFSGAAADAPKTMDLYKALAEIYSAAHRAETARLAAMGADQQGQANIESVWGIYDRQVAMLRVLISGEEPAAIPVTAPVAAPVSAPVTTQPPAALASGGGPMGFFAKKPDSAQPAPPPAPSEVPVAVPDAPVPPPQSPAPASPPVSAPASAPPAGASPMAFFKKSKEGESEG